MTFKHTLLIDGNSIAHANHNATKLTCGTLQVQAIFGFLNSLKALLDTQPGECRPIVLWDGKADFRFDLYPDYKGNRKAMDAKQEAHKEAFKKQTPFIELALKHLGVPQFRSPRLEADDLAAHFSRVWAAEGRRVTLVSGDKDWIQLIAPTITWFDPIRDRSVRLDTLLDSTGYQSVEAFAEGKALTGDSSDNVTGVGGIGEKGAPVLLAEHGSVYRLFERVDAGEKLKLGAALQRLVTPEGRAVFERNMNLMDLRRSRRPGPGEVIVDLGKPDPEKFKQLCERLHFASILRRWGEFARAFRLNEHTALAA